MVVWRIWRQEKFFLNFLTFNILRDFRFFPIWILMQSHAVWIIKHLAVILHIFWSIEALYHVHQMSTTIPESINLDFFSQKWVYFSWTTNCLLFFFYKKQHFFVYFDLNQTFHLVKKETKILCEKIGNFKIGWWDVTNKILNAMK